MKFSATHDSQIQVLVGICPRASDSYTQLGMSSQVAQKHPVFMSKNKLSLFPTLVLLQGPPTHREALSHGNDQEPALTPPPPDLIDSQILLILPSAVISDATFCLFSPPW